MVAALAGTLAKEVAKHEADLAMKERALARLQEPDTKMRRYRAPDSLLEFLKTL